MNHLLVTREYPPAPCGGIGTYFRTWARMLADAGERVQVVAPAAPTAPPGREDFHDGRLTIHRVPFQDFAAAPERKPHPDLGDSRSLRLFRGTYYPLAFANEAAKAVESIVAAEPIDIIESHDWSAPLALLQEKWRKRPPPGGAPPILLGFHSPSDAIAYHNGDDIKSPFMRAAAKRELESALAADRLFEPVPSEMGFRPDIVDTHDVSVAILPLPLPDVAVEKRSVETWRTGTVLVTGRLQPLKGVMEFTTAAVAVARDLPDLVFEFAGGDTRLPGRSNRMTSDAMRDMIPGGMRERFRFLGALDESGLAAARKRARLAAMPSRFEMFCYAGLEAMASGLPVVSTAVGAMPEVIVDPAFGGASKTWWAKGETPCGFLAAEASPGAIEAALRRALATPPQELASLGAESARRVREYCGGSRVFERHLDLRREVAESVVLRSTTLHVTGMDLSTLLGSGLARLLGRRRG